MAPVECLQRRIPLLQKNLFKYNGIHRTAQFGSVPNFNHKHYIMFQNEIQAIGVIENDEVSTTTCHPERSEGSMRQERFLSRHKAAGSE
jgi:hypothetical protein